LGVDGTVIIRARKIVRNEESSVEKSANYSQKIPGALDCTFDASKHSKRRYEPDEDVSLVLMALERTYLEQKTMVHSVMNVANEYPKHHTIYQKLSESA
jgi:hypothetical protein